MTADATTPDTITTARPQRRGRWRGRLALILGIVLVLVADLALAGTLIVRGALPQTTGTIHLAGPHGAITVQRDSYGVPHVQATDTHDAFFGQGYVTAQDRLWQMEFNRRVAAGRLSEILGKSTVGADKLLRTLGLTQSAQADLDNLTPSVRQELDAYTQGVNAFLDGHRDSLPIEFRLLGFTPEPWHAIDSLAYGKVVALSLDGTWNTKLSRMNVLAASSQKVADALFPSYPNDNPTLIDATGTNEIAPNSSETAPPTAPAVALTVLTPVQQAALGHLLPTTAGDDLHWLREAVLGNIASSEGSNDWVVAGSHTTTGMPLLANDPHLGIQYPSIWYEVALSGGGLNEIGFSFPGVPSVIIGHNDYVAWGVTNGQVDDTDLYLEKLSADGTTYLFNGQQLPVQTRTETIKVSGGADIHLTVRSTGHGPLLNDSAGQLKDNMTPIALHWTALQPGYSFSGFFELGAAQSLDELQAAIGNISISQNFVFADTRGNIGYHLSGWVPIRPAANGLLPVDGTTSANDWTGRVAFDQMPHLMNPPSGIIWTANNRITSSDYPYYITNDWDIGFRARRIEQLLTAQPKLSADDIARIQSDVVSVPAQQIAPYFANAASANNADRGPRTAQALLAGWDGTMSRDSAAAAFYEVTASRLLQDIVKPLLKKKAYDDWQANEYAISKILVLRNALTTPGLLFADNAARDAAIRTAENEAYDDLKSQLKTDDIHAWHWGDLHMAHFDHPLTAVAALKLILPNQGVARPGDISTVNVGGDGSFSANDYGQDSLPSMREIIDLGNLDASRYVTTTGESGQSFSAHNFDLLSLWDSGRYQPMTFTASAVNAAATETLILQP